MSEETYTRTVRFETPRLTASKAGRINRAMKDYRRARQMACDYFAEYGTSGFTYGDREDLRKKITAHDRINLTTRNIYPAITIAEMNYKVYENDPSWSAPQPNNADTLGLEAQRTRIFYDDGTYYITIHVGTGYIPVPIITTAERYHTDRLPQPDVVPATDDVQQRVPGVQFSDLGDDELPADTVGIQSSTLKKLDGDRRFRFNLVFRIRKPITNGPSIDTARYIVGVDRGRNELAYACLYDRSDDHVLSWWNQSGDEVRHKMDGYESRIAEFQRARVYDEMESLRTRRIRYKRQLDYEIANGVVELARERFGCAIALEALSGMSRLGAYPTENRRFSHWSYYRLGEYIKEKATPYDIPVVEVEPAYTSVTCSRCGEREQTRRNSVHFYCTECEYQQHADANASVNIAKSAATVEQ